MKTLKTLKIIKAALLILLINILSAYFAAKIFEPPLTYILSVLFGGVWGLLFYDRLKEIQHVEKLEKEKIKYEKNFKQYEDAFYSLLDEYRPCVKVIVCLCLMYEWQLEEKELLNGKLGYILSSPYEDSSNSLDEEQYTAFKYVLERILPKYTKYTD